jgi:hypothetical protein
MIDWLLFNVLQVVFELYSGRVQVQYYIKKNYVEMREEMGSQFNVVDSHWKHGDLGKDDKLCFL